MTDRPAAQCWPLWFNAGASGRRAALVAGPDVWEVISAGRASGAKDEKRAVEAVAAEMSLSPAQARIVTENVKDFRPLLQRGYATEILSPRYCWCRPVDLPADRAGAPQ